VVTLRESRYQTAFGNFPLDSFFVIQKFVHQNDTISARSKLLTGPWKFTRHRLSNPVTVDIV